MTDRLDAFARRAAGDPAFLAWALQQYAASESLDGTGLARALGCARATLGSLGLCRRPRPERVIEDVAAIAGRFGVEEDTLLVAVRRADVLEALRGAEMEIMAAARDREEER